MPIFTYFSVVGAALLALLFVADAKFERHGPLALSTNFEGLPKPWKPELNPPLPAAKPPELRVAEAPVLDPRWNEPKPVEAAVATPQKAEPEKKLAKAEPAKAEPAPKKQKHAAARKRPQYAPEAQRYAWRHDNGGWFGGGGNPWRF